MASFGSSKLGSNLNITNPPMQNNLPFQMSMIGEGDESAAALASFNAALSNSGLQQQQQPVSTSTSIHNPSNNVGRSTADFKKVYKMNVAKGESGLNLGGNLANIANQAMIQQQQQSLNNNFVGKKISNTNNVSNQQSTNSSVLPLSPRNIGGENAHKNDLINAMTTGGGSRQNSKENPVTSFSPVSRRSMNQNQQQSPQSDDVNVISPQQVSVQTR